MATDIMIKFEGGNIPIEGESTVAGFEKQLEAMSFQEAFSNPHDVTGKGQVASRTNVMDVQISSVASQHSNLLKRSMIENNAFTTVTISFLKQVGNKTELYETRTYKNVYVTSSSMGKSNEAPGQESWSFAATEISGAYKIQDMTTHQLTDATTFTFDAAGSTTS
jgi:type VI protein secretion system component Hcp